MDFYRIAHTFCMSVGSTVFMLDKTTFYRTPKKFPGSVVNTPVENLLQEEYDYNFIHAYVSASIVAYRFRQKIIYYKMK